MTNPSGVEWLIDGHVHVPTIGSLRAWRSGKKNKPQDLYPSIVPQNFSDRLTSFIAAVDRCTSKTLLFLDTTPGLRPGSAPTSHWLDTACNPGTNLIFLDAFTANETVVAHEVGHAWVEYVDQCEDKGSSSGLSTQHVYTS
jgi:hypothetical protein